jgi:tRNA pseudouridine55 synthase
VRIVEVRALELVSWSAPELTFRAHCGKGTYVRSLAVDLAARLGSVAHLSALRRERSGGFGLDRALPLDEVRADARGAILPRLVSPAEALAELPAEGVVAAGVVALGRGQPVAGSGPACEGPIRLLGPSGALVAIGQWRDGRIWPVRVLLG